VSTLCHIRLTVPPSPLTVHQSGAIPYTFSFTQRSGADVVIASAVPEPATMALVGLALIALGTIRYRRS